MTALFEKGLDPLDGQSRSGVQPREDVHHGEHGKKTPRPRRSFTPEFKAEIVELCRRGDRSVGQIAKAFDLTETAVRLWVSQAEVDAGERDGLTSSEREELAALRRENRRLREDVEVLRRATAFFAKETR
ncbi:transposase [Streptomyces europaeiscabiei]|uniref:transposase n=1 Tax=Streptomyces europaeiscabiei TaxID=146819 RepID=UPI0029C9E2BF|nr:transposase [Streptomyces europaeiscabiei]